MLKRINKAFANHIFHFTVPEGSARTQTGGNNEEKVSRISGEAIKKYLQNGILPGQGTHPKKRKEGWVKDQVLTGDAAPCWPYK